MLGILATSLMKCASADRIKVLFCLPSALCKTCRQTLGIPSGNHVTFPTAIAILAIPSGHAFAFVWAARCETRCASIADPKIVTDNFVMTFHYDEQCATSRPCTVTTTHR